MRNFKETFLKIFHTERSSFILMIFNLVFALALIIFSIISLNPNASVAKIGYGDIGGYRDGSWSDLLAFPLLALIFGVFHNFLALRIFEKRGSGMAKFFLLITTMLIAGTFLVLIRTLGEG